MNKEMLGVIDATTSTADMSELTLTRSIAALPIAGRYRLIDFMLSNMVNSDIHSVAIFPKHQYRSLMDHLGSGKQWDLDRKRDGLFFCPTPMFESEEDGGHFFKRLEHHIDYFLRSKQKYTLITNSHTLCNIDFSPILRRHIELGCDITEVQKDGMSLNMYILETSLLLDLMMNFEQNGYRTMEDVTSDPRSRLRVCNYAFTGYAAVIDTIDAYYKHSLELLSPVKWNQLFDSHRPIFTKVKDEPPTRYQTEADVTNSIIANGCIINGTVENSIISRGVKIGKGAVIKNSIIMQKTQIGEGAYLDGVIIDKDVKVEKDVELIKQIQPVVIRKGTIQGAVMNS